jgi:transaldolase
MEHIQEAAALGILHGVTTNPSIIAQGSQPIHAVLKGLLEVQSGPIAVQVVAQDADGMVGQACALYAYSKRTIIKLPITLEGLKAMHALSKKNIPTMATALFNLSQALFAARAGAHYIAPYFAKIAETGQDPCRVLHSIMHMYDKYDFPTKVLAAALRNPEQVLECIAIGIHAVTIKEEVYRMFVQDNPSTRQHVEKFQSDWQQTSSQVRSFSLQDYTNIW